MPEVGCLHPGATDAKMGLYRQMIGRVLRPGRGQARCDRPRSFRRRVSPRLCRGSRRMDARSRSPRRQSGPPAAAKPKAARACSNARNAAPCASPAKPVRIADSCRSGHRALVDSSTAISAWSTATAERNGRSHRSGAARALARNAGVDRRRARLQARLDRAQIQGKIRHLAAVGRCACRRSQPTPEVRSWVRSRQIAFARSGRHEAKHGKISGQFAPRTIEMLRSPAMARAQSVGAPHSRPHRDRARQPWRQGQRQVAGHVRRI